MPTARIVEDAEGQFVLLPQGIGLRSDEVEIYRRGEEVVLRDKPRTLADAFKLLCELPLDDS